eukprot:CAMPEP_0180810350 /NCGR_PEP_ID=MMETSP1038_2-20121128/64835_1 /TAXON_ID=632150 /ORGANISM="Azadinium spinosum, Strain 3D9" /LENGTH=43 /DNA_ID= /DNA_START= /DNA_END= /DNA_ORIENTATION=
MSPEVEMEKRSPEGPKVGDVTGASCRPRTCIVVAMSKRPRAEA